MDGDVSTAPEPAADAVRRYVVKAVATAWHETMQQRELPTEQLILLLGEAPTVSAALHAALTEGGYRVRHIVPGRQTRRLSQERFEVDFSSVDSVKALYNVLTQAGDTIGAVCSLLGLAEYASDAQAQHLDAAKQLFMLLQVCETDLKDSASNGGGWLLVFTALGGQFGLRSTRTFPVGSAGPLGVAKSVAREWPQIRVKCIDLDLQMEPYMIAAQVWEELHNDAPHVEVGFTETGRWVIDVQEDTVSLAPLSQLNLPANAVLLATGGAYGITAEVIKAMLQQYRLHLVLVGRSPLPQAEPLAIQDLPDAQAIRQVLLQEGRVSGKKIKVVEIERQLTRILKDRQIRANLAAFAQAGASVEYHTLDVRDADAFGTLIDTVYDRFGRIDGVLHGAGVIADRLVRHKSLESFTQVFETKVVPATVLAARLRPETLKFLAFFSSVSGRFGNAGQTDYSAANEVLNKLANRLDHAWPDAHVVSLNWGPWDAGMVHDEVRRLYATYGVTLIPTAVGARFGVEELQRGKTGASEVVITASLERLSTWRLPHA